MADAPLATLTSGGVLVLAAWGVLALPLLSFLVNGLWLGRKHAAASGWTAAALMGGTAALAVVLALGYHDQVLGRPEFPANTAIAFDHVWMAFGEGMAQAAKLGFYLDPISVMMVLVIAFVSFLVHVYSIGYMQGDPGAGRFFPTLSFFTFAMLGLVVSSNLIQTFFFWELVGVASYLLIGFWYRKPAAVAASKKAFIMTRFADAFFLMGVLTVGLKAEGFDFLVVNSAGAAAALDHHFTVGLFQVNLLTLGTLLIYAGAWGKSAMFPLHGWLPDAMEGPTPVSSLIHSATMVVAGIYLTARLYPLFSAADATMTVVELTGSVTAVFAAVIACTQTDLKRILAFSTLSQLGLMMASLGAGAAGGEAAHPMAHLAYTASMFHVFTHAFFKCLLFLSAGVVIHAIHSNDIRDAGGLRKVLPFTYGATLFAVLAIAGFPPFSGFFSKEELLLASLANGRHGAFMACLVTGGLTAFYMTRYFLLVFHGSGPGANHGHAHSSPTASHHASREGLLMVLPILILALPSAVIGWLAKDFFVAFVVPGHSPAAAEAHAGSHSWLPLVAVSLATIGAGVAWWRYGGRAGRPSKAGNPEADAPAWHRLIRNGFHFDDLYLFLARKVGGRLVASPSNWLERTVINGSFDLGTGLLRRLAALQGRFQNGHVQRYIAVALLGLVLLYVAGRMMS